MQTCDSVMHPLLTVEREGFKLTGAPIAPHAFEAAPGGFITKSPLAAYGFIHYADFRAERVLRRAKEVFEASKSLSCKKSLRRHPLGFSYFPYQVAGIDFMQKHKRCLNADEPGTGKTVQIAGLINETDVKRVLVLCPASLRLNWLYEIHKWVFRELEALEVVSYDSVWRKSYFKKLLVIML